MRKTATWSPDTGFAIPEAQRRRVLRAIADAALWADRNQIRHAWPDWDANLGRVPKVQNIRTGTSSRSTVWALARLCQGLLSGARVLAAHGARPALIRAIENTAELGLYQDTRAQIYDPEFPELRGAFREETPICFQINPRDGVECSMGFLVKRWYDGPRADPLWMNRAADHLRWCTSWLMKRPDWPMEYLFFGWDYVRKPDQLPRAYANAALRIQTPHSPLTFYNAALLIPLCQHVRMRGAKPGREAVRLGHWLLDNLFDEASGALRIRGASLGHHSDQLGGIPGVPSNDDGVMVAILCLDRVHPEPRLQQAALRNAAWWLNLRERPHLYAATPAAMIFLLDVARLTGRREYLDWVLARLDGLLALQCRRRDPRVQGAFLGEDGGRRFQEFLGCPPGETASLRMTSYALIALSKLAANAKTWSPAYSRFGW